MNVAALMHRAGVSRVDVAFSRQPMTPDVTVGVTVAVEKKLAIDGPYTMPHRDLYHAEVVLPRFAETIGRPDDVLLDGVVSALVRSIERRIEAERA